ncbi:MAG TPA: hypothetical protein VHQ90_13465 [Thermoanaerobaculia bacterium]|nr:hypothetical protein [Thermoanaerobaculia bacterium]
MPYKLSWVIALLALASGGSGVAALAPPGGAGSRPDSIGLAGSLPGEPRPAAPAAGKTADEVIADYIAARGGRARWDAIRTVRLTGKVSGGGLRELPITVEKKRPDKSRRELDDPKGRLITAFDGRTAWQLGGPDGGTRVRPLPEAAVRQVRRSTDFDGPLVDYKAKGSQVDFLGRERVGDAEAYRLRIRFKEGDEAFFDFDTKTHLLIRSVAVVPTPAGTQEVEVSYRDYKKAGGVLWPHTEVSAAQPSFTQTFSWDKIEPNVPLDDRIFKMPAY